MHHDLVCVTTALIACCALAASAAANDVSLSASSAGRCGGSASSQRAHATHDKAVAVATNAHTVGGHHIAVV